eukprot:4935199-Pyramimonas_sp.AAC.1
MSSPTSERRRCPPRTGAVSRRGCPTRDPGRSPVNGSNPWNMLSSPLRLVCSRGDPGRLAWGNSQINRSQGQGILSQHPHHRPYHPHNSP